MEKKSFVKQFMTQPVFSVPADSLLEQAEKIFHEYRLTTAPVVIDKKNVIGIMTDFKLLKCFLLKNSDPLRAKVKDYAEEFDPVILIDEDEPISNAFKLMIQSPNHRVYVTSQGRLVGALSPKDILPFMAGDEAVERYKENQDLISARIKIKLLMAELSNAQAKLDKYEQAFSSSPFMIHSVDMSGKIVMANKMIHHVLGYAPDELIGKSITDLYSTQFHQQAKAGLDRVKVTGFHPLTNTLMVKKNQELIQVDIASAAKVSQTGDIIGTITIGRISDNAKMIEALAVVGRALKESELY